MISLWEVLVPVYMKDKTEFTSISYSDKLCSDDLYYIKKKQHDIFDEFVRVRSIKVTIFRSATGDLIKPMYQDDFFYSDNAIEVMVNKLEEDNST